MGREAAVLTSYAATIIATSGVCTRPCMTQLVTIALRRRRSRQLAAHTISCSRASSLLSVLRTEPPRQRFVTRRSMSSTKRTKTNLAILPARPAKQQGKKQKRR